MYLAYLINLRGGKERKREKRRKKREKERKRKRRKEREEKKGRRRRRVEEEKKGGVFMAWEVLVASLDATSLTGGRIALWPLCRSIFWATAIAMAPGGSGSPAWPAMEVDSWTQRLRALCPGALHHFVHVGQRQRY